MRWSGILSEKPPGPLDWYENLEDIPLVLASGNPSGWFIGAVRYRPNPPVEVDVFETSVGEMDLILQDGTTETVELVGRSEMHVYFEGEQEGEAVDDDGDGWDEVRVELVEWSLSGLSPLLGLVEVRLNPELLSIGEMQEVANNIPGVLEVPPFAVAGTTVDSYFDVYVEVEAGGMLLHTEQPMRWSGILSEKPPGPLDWYENLEDIPLVLPSGNPSGYSIGAARYEPNP